MKSLLILLINLFLVPIAFSDGIHVDVQHFRILDTDGDAMLNIESIPGREWEIIAGNDGGFYIIKDKTAGSYRLAIDTNGNVGVGTTNSSYKLYIDNQSPVPSSIDPALFVNSGHNSAGPNDVTIVRLQGSNSGLHRYLDIKSQWTASTTGAIVLEVDGDAGALGDSLVLQVAGGNVGIGTASPSSYKLHVNGTAYATGAAGALSDKRHKKNIHDLYFKALEVVTKLHPVSYEWKNPIDSGMEGPQIGFLAQEVEKVLPQSVLIQDNMEKTKGLKFNEFIPILTKAIQEQQQMIDQLKQKHGKQNQKISRLGQRNDQLQQKVDLQKQEYDQQIKQLVSLLQKMQEQTAILAKQIKVLQAPQTQTVAWAD